MSALIPAPVIMTEQDLITWKNALGEITKQEISDTIDLAPDDKKPTYSAARIRALARRYSLNPMINAPALIIKSNSTYPPVAATLTDTNGAINLTTATSLTFVMKGVTSLTVVTGTATITNAATGQVSYSWGASDTLQADSYQVEWAIHWTGGLQIVPSAAATNQVIEIDADLDGAIG